MNGFKLFRFLGATFMLVGVAVCAAMFLAVGWKGVFVGLLFGFFGSFFYLIGNAFLAGQKEILKEGKSYRGKIYAYRPDHSIVINGVPAQSVVIRYFDDVGDEREAVCPTGSSDISVFPVGASVSFSILNGRYAVSSASVGFDKLAHEEVLMDDRLMTAEHVHMVAVSCKSCGASYQAAGGYTARCPFCGTYCEVA